MIKDTFEALLIAPNTEFYQNFAFEKLSWQGGTKTFKFEELSHLAKTMCNDVASSNEWDAVNPKDTTMMALSTQVS